MSLSPCNTTVDSQGRELVQHGLPEFPIGCYHDDLGAECVPWHWHDELEAVVVSEGSTVVAAGSRKFIVRQGEGFFVNAGILHGCWDHEDSGCRYHSLVFHPSLVGGSAESVFFRAYVQPLAENQAAESLILTPDVPWQKAALEAIETAWQTCVHEPPGYEFQVRDALSRLIYLLHSALPQQPKPSAGKAARDGERIKQMLRYIHDHYGDELLTADIAAAASISESECLRCFRTTVRTTPIQYLRQYRLQQACAQLTSTGDKIADIAARCGFPDISYFTKTFRQEKGMVPSEYRRKNRI